MLLRFPVKEEVRPASPRVRFGKGGVSGHGGKGRCKVSLEVVITSVKLAQASASEVGFAC